MISISSERLAFKTLGVEDVSSDYVDWLNDPDVNQFLETRFAAQSEASCRKFVTDMMHDPASHLFGIYIGSSSEHIGNIKLGFINSNHRTGQISFFIGSRAYWGQGYATEAIRRITRWGFDELGLARIEAGCYENNFSSLRALLKANYTVEGFFRKSIEFNGSRIGCFKLGILSNE